LRRRSPGGVSTLIYDKWTIGYSLLRRDYDLLAADAAAAVALLGTRRDVDPSRVRLWGQSEGAYVGPLACLRSSAVKFVLTVGAVGVTQAVQTAWGYDQFLRPGSSSVVSRSGEQLAEQLGADGDGGGAAGGWLRAISSRTRKSQQRLRT
jgi:hypothetical protein